MPGLDVDAASGAESGIIRGSNLATSADTSLAAARRLLGSNPAEAAALARRIAAANPRAVEPRFVLGAALRRSGAFEAALAVLSPLAAALPTVWGVHYEQGMTLAALGLDAGVAALEQAVSLNPGSPLAAHALADQLLARGDVVAGVALPGGPADPQVAAGAAALLDGRADEAERILVAGFGLHLNDIAALRMVADAGMRLGRADAAVTLLQGVLEIAPAYLPARHALATALASLDRSAEALVEADRLVAARPGTAAFAALRAGVLMQLGRVGEAIIAYDRALTLQPGEARIWNAYGHALRAAGRRDDAIAAYRRAVTLRPEFGEAWWSIANLKTRAFAPGDQDRMSAILERGDLATDDRYYLLFALAKALEDDAHYAMSFRICNEANTLRRAAEPYDAAAAKALIDRSVATFDAVFFHERTGVGAADASPIFIVGMPRSGSTLVEQILSSHSAVEGSSELADITAIAQRLAHEGAGLSYPESLTTLDADRFAALGEDYIARTRHRRPLGRLHFVDKFPGNFMHIGLIHLILPQARIIDVRRHPMACCLSLYKQAFAQGQRYAYDLGDLGRAYADYVRLMAHFDAVLPGKVLRVSYETLVDAPEAQVRRLMDHLGLAFEPACMRFFETDRVIRTPSSEQVRQPIYRDAVDHWRHFEPFLGPLADALGPLTAR